MLPRKSKTSISVQRRQQGGYAILLVLFLATLMLLATMTVAPNILTDGRREREKEMIWRGKQYTRGIKMFYRKTGKFPTSLEDLTKPKIGNIRFMRQAYKDPMNPKDGEWRLIYVGPAGQLIGSLKPQRALQLAGVGGFQSLTAPNIGGASVPGAQGIGQGFGQSLGQAANQIGGNLGSTPQTSGFGSAAASQPGGAASADTSLPGGLSEGDTPDSEAATDALLNTDPPVVMGGNIIGVGSKINRRSIITFDKAKNYRQFEFIWDPSKDALIIGGTGAQPGIAPGTQQPQASPLGTQGATSPNPTSPNGQPEPMPPETTPEPPQP